MVKFPNIIPTISLFAHTLFQFQGFQEIYSLFTDILDATVKMKYHSFCKRSVPVCHPDGRDYGMGSIHMITYGPFDQFVIKKIQHSSQIKKSIHIKFFIFCFLINSDIHLCFFQRRTGTINEHLH